jgi:hypothetical protein
MKVFGKSGPAPVVWLRDHLERQLGIKHGQQIKATALGEAAYFWTAVESLSRVFPAGASRVCQLRTAISNEARGTSVSVVYGDSAPVTVRVPER